MFNQTKKKKTDNNHNKKKKKKKKKANGMTKICSSNGHYQYRLKSNS